MCYPRPSPLDHHPAGYHRRCVSAERPTARGGPTRDRSVARGLGRLAGLDPGEEQLGELELITSGAFAPLGGYLSADDLAAVAARGSSPTARRGRSRSRSPSRRRRPGRGRPAGAGGPGGLAAGRPRDHRAGPGSSGSGAGPAGRPGHRAARARARAVPRAAADARPMCRARRPAHGPVLALRDQAAARPAADRPAPAPGRPAQGPDPAAAAGGRPGRGGDPAGVAGPGRRSPPPAACPRTPLVVPVPLPPRERQARADGQVRELATRARIAAAYGATHLMADSGRAGTGLSPFGGADFDLARRGRSWSWPPATGPTTRVAEVWRPLGPDRGRDRAGRPVRRSARRPARRRGAGARVVHARPRSPAELRRRAAAPLRARVRAVPDRAVRVGQVHASPGTCATCCSERGDRTGLAARRRPGPAAALRRADVLPRGPRPEHRPHRLRGRRDRPARRHRDLRADRALRGGPGRGQARWSPRSATSCSSTSPRRVEVCEARDRKGLYAKARAGVIGSSPGSPTPTRSRTTPTW